MCVGIGMGGTVIWENPHWTATATDALTEEGAA
jgi:acetyl-CoA acyltransferase